MKKVYFIPEVETRKFWFSIFNFYGCSFCLDEAGAERLTSDEAQQLILLVVGNPSIPIREIGTIDV